MGVETLLLSFLINLVSGCVTSLLDRKDVANARRLEELKKALDDPKSALQRALV